MRTGSSYVATAVALGIISLTGCSIDKNSDNGPAPGEDWGDDKKYPEIGGAYHALDSLNGNNTGCAFASGTITITSTIAQTIVVGKRAVDSAILVNGNVCNTSVAPIVAANASTLKRLVVNGSSNAEVLILDFLGGLLAPGVASAAAGGIVINLGGGTDAVNIRGTSGTDTFFVGADGIAFNADNYKDITLTDVESVNLALAGGNDAVTATNASPTRGITGSAALPLTIYGGTGNDVLLGGGQQDSIWGGPGNDTLSGGAGADFLYGEEGADTMDQTAAADGDDTLDCGDESPTNTSVDIVSYEKRTNAITAVLGGGAGADGGVDAGGGADAGDGGVGVTGTAGEGSEQDSVALNCESLVGGKGNDNLTGNDQDNILNGFDGDDTITGGDGDDVLSGGKGDDTFLEGSAENGSDIFNGGDDEDTLDYSSRTGDLTVTMDGTAANDGLDGEQDNVKADVENLLAGSGADRITGNSGHNKLTGNLGNDQLTGGAGNDTFLEGSADTDSDVFNGGVGEDTVDYSGRTNALVVTMDGVTADDGESGVSEGDNVKSDVENLLAGAGNDNITGNIYNNEIQGGAGNDTISGLDGDDTLDGTNNGAGVDNDIICGGGSDVAYNKGDDGSYATDCETKGL
jgi:Ca2+-binding RTX toxin-like protein